MADFLTIVFGLIHGGLLMAAARAARRLVRAPGLGPQEREWPAVRVVLPFAGGGPGTRDSLDDLAAQDYPRFEIRLACHGADEAACALAREWMRGREGSGGPRVELALAETARGCGQKNQNLLAAVGGVGSADQVLVFTDAGYRRPADWLRRLVEPLEGEGRAVSSGYYHAEVGPGFFGAWRPVTALLLFLTRQHAAFRQPWGGATAIRRGLFDELGVADLWSTNVVDDVALAERLRGAGIPVRGVIASALWAPAQEVGEGGWGAWFTRQLGYLRAIQPGAWAGIGAGLLAVGGGLLWMIGMALAGGRGCPEAAGLAALDLASWAALGLGLRAAHPRPGGRARWLGAFFGFWLAAPICHLRTARGRTIRWRGVEYRVGRGGTVRSTSGAGRRGVG